MRNKKLKRIAALTLSLISGLTLTIGQTPIAHADGGASSGGGDIYVKQYNRVRAAWANRFEWMIENHELVQSHSRSKSEDCDRALEITCDLPLANRIKALLSEEAKRYKVQSTPEIIRVVDPKLGALEINGYSRKQGLKYETKFNFIYWKSLSPLDREIFVLHETLVLLGVETTNDFSMSEPYTRGFTDRAKTFPTVQIEREEGSTTDLGPGGQVGFELVTYETPAGEEGYGIFSRVHTEVYCPGGGGGGANNSAFSKGGGGGNNFGQGEKVVGKGSSGNADTGDGVAWNSIGKLEPPPDGPTIKRGQKYLLLKPGAEMGEGSQGAAGEGGEANAEGGDDLFGERRSPSLASQLLPVNASEDGVKGLMGYVGRVIPQACITEHSQNIKRRIARVCFHKNIQPRMIAIVEKREKEK
jgi:hypothetical protein